MKLNSPLFDGIRVKPDKDRRLRTELPACEWAGCKNGATHRAPKGRGRENEYHRFCLDHVREFNHSYNFFKDMSADAVASYQKDSLTGHRPTWKLGAMGGVGRKPRVRDRVAGADPLHDPFGIFGRAGATRTAEETQRQKTVHNAARKALDELSLEVTATKAEIKARFKDLVKRHHPDANGGDQSSEDKLREIIVAYNYLKSAGYC
ncbi:MAG: J domain-containing protein [Xanthobacteraceae bacterium]